MISDTNIYSAAKVLEGNILKTPQITSPLLSESLNCELFLKLECLQYTSSFKARGAYVAMETLDSAQKKKGVIAMSAGNHAQAVAYHAGKMNIPVVIVMPAQTPFSKIARTKAFGAEVVLQGRNLNECETKVEELVSSRGLTLIHPYDNASVIAGQGTVGLEMVSDQPDLDVLVVPIGGGGLISGIATIIKALKPNIRIIGVQSELYPSMQTAIYGGDLKCKGESLAEGIAVKRPGELTLPIIRSLVDEIVLVSEKHLEWAVSALVEQQRIVSEGAGAAGIAAIHAFPELFSGCKVGAVVCGGNIDPRLLSSILNRNMAIDGRIARLRIDITDEPGMLAAITDCIGRCGANIIEIYHQRLFFDVPAKLAKIDAIIETRDPGHIQEIITDLENKHFKVRLLKELSD
jgi:threonine dehydratase